MGEGGALLLPGYRVLIPDSIFKEPRQFRRSRHCEPTGRANARPMTGSAKQSILPRKERMDCFVASLLAMTGLRCSVSPLLLWESIGRLRRPFLKKDAEAKLRL